MQMERSDISAEMVYNLLSLLPERSDPLERIEDGAS